MASRSTSPRKRDSLAAASDTQAVAKLLREYAQRTALCGGNPYRAKAYSRAADSLAASQFRSTS
jgi:DNA polymerase/3'-5' exonuclease PolX